MSVNQISFQVKFATDGTTAQRSFGTAKFELDTVQNIAITKVQVAASSNVPDASKQLYNWSLLAYPIDRAGEPIQKTLNVTETEATFEASTYSTIVWPISKARPMLDLQLATPVNGFVVYYIEQSFLLAPAASKIQYSFIVDYELI